MNDKILNFTGQTTADVSVNQVLNDIPQDDLEHVVVLGIDKEGYSRAWSSSSDAALMIYMMEKFKHNLLSGVYG